MTDEHYVTAGELRVIIALADHGRIADAAIALGLSRFTARNLLLQARRRMGLRANCQLTYLLGCGELDEIR